MQFDRFINNYLRWSYRIVKRGDLFFCIHFRSLYRVCRTVRLFKQISHVNLNSKELPSIHFFVTKTFFLKLKCVSGSLFVALVWQKDFFKIIKKVTTYHQIQSHAKDLPVVVPKAPAVRRQIFSSYIFYTSSGHKFFKSSLMVSLRKNN